MDLLKQLNNRIDKLEKETEDAHYYQRNPLRGRGLAMGEMGRGFK